MQQALAKPFAPEDLEWRLQNTIEEKMCGLAVPYATEGTAIEIARLGTDVEIVGKLGRDNRVFQLLENGRIDYVILTGSTEPTYIRDFIHLNHRCVQLGIPCLTSLDTANALTDILASRYNQRNTELIDICHLRAQRQSFRFAKLQTCGNDYIVLENFRGEITCPESLCVTFCDRHYGIGADGIVLIEGSNQADARIRLFKADGSEDPMSGNALRCVGKYLYDNGIAVREDLRLETDTGIRAVHLYTTKGKVTSASGDMGRALLNTAALRFEIPEKSVVDYPVSIGGQSFNGDSSGTFQIAGLSNRSFYSQSSFISNRNLYLSSTSGRSQYRYL